MNVFLEILIHPILVVSLISGALSQFIKMILVSLRRKEIILDVLWKGYGNKAGMPSSHTAFMASATTAIFILEGGITNLFMLALITTLIIIQTVVDLKFHFDKASEYINEMFDVVFDFKEDAWTKFEHVVGHTYNQIIVGAILGIYTTLKIMPMLL
jgi:acid phosphatase family membrane protein YuiD